MKLFPDTEANRLTNIQISLEKSRKLILEHLKKYSNYDIFEYYEELESSRLSDQNLLQTKVKDIVESLKIKVKLAIDDKLKDITDLKQFKTEMILIQENIHNLKLETKMKLKALDRDQVNFAEDLHFYNEKVLEWTEPAKVNIFCNTYPRKPKTVRTVHEYQEVNEFMKFIHTSGGHQNGWRREDHQLFINLRNKHNKNIENVARELNDIYPDISIQEVRQHEEWYKKYLLLLNKKRKAIKMWKDSQKKNEACTMKFSNVNSTLRCTVQTEQNNQEKLLEWKAKQEEKMRNAQAVDVLRKHKILEIDKAKKKRQQELKRIVREWKQTKAITEQQKTLETQLAEQQEKKRRSMEANRMIKQFQSQDDMYITKMRQQRQRQDCPPVRSKSSQLAKRDPNRLLKPTKQWINRVHDENLPPVFIPILPPLKYLPKLGVPDWRRNLV